MSSRTLAPEYGVLAKWGGVHIQVIRENVDRSARILTDESLQYRGIGKEYARGHETVNHSRYEYARGDVTTNVSAR